MPSGYALEGAPTQMAALGRSRRHLSMDASLGVVYTLPSRKSASKKISPEGVVVCVTRYDTYQYQVRIYRYNYVRALQQYVPVRTAVSGTFSFFSTVRPSTYCCIWYFFSFFFSILFITYQVCISALFSLHLLSWPFFFSLPPVNINSILIVVTQIRCHMNSRLFSVPPHYGYWYCCAWH